MTWTDLCLVVAGTVALVVVLGGDRPMGRAAPPDVDNPSTVGVNSVSAAGPGTRAADTPFANRSGDLRPVDERVPEPLIDPVGSLSADFGEVAQVTLGESMDPDDARVTTRNTNGDRNIGSLEAPEDLEYGAGSAHDPVLLGAQIDPDRAIRLPSSTPVSLGPVLAVDP